MSENLENTDFKYNSDINYDEETLRQQKCIEDEINTTQPLIGNLEDIFNLEMELATDQNFVTKVQKLKKNYSHFRRVRGDGNCFYRAFGFACFENFIKNKDNIKDFRERADRCKEHLVTLGYHECSIEDFHSMFLDMLKMVEEGCTVDKLIETLNEQFTSDYVVVFLRLLVSSHLQMESDFYSSFIEGDKSIKEFCTQEVEPMNKESDQIHIIALTSFTGVGVRIEYMDRVGDSYTCHDFPEGSTPQMSLLYRPGHYDILAK